MVNSTMVVRMAEITFAGKDDKLELYKFRSFQSPEDKARVREIILDHKVYFSKRSQLNDPSDLAPVLKINREGGERECRRRLMADAELRLRDKSHGFSNEYILHQLAYLSTCDLEKFEIEARARALKGIERDYLIFSLAGNRTHPMLWGHYADGHKGVCIHFSSLEPSIFAAAMKVAYHYDRPVLGIPLPDEGELLRTITLWKGDFWQYENEYRLVRAPGLSFDDLGLVFDGQKASYKSSWIRGITVGANMSSQDEKEVLRIAKSHEPALPVYRALPTLTYDVDFEQIASA
jgi:hypothetical protein